MGHAYQLHSRILVDDSSPQTPGSQLELVEGGCWSTTVRAAARMTQTNQRTRTRTFLCVVPLL